MNGEAVPFAAALNDVNNLLSKMKQVLKSIIPSLLESIYICVYVKGSRYIKV